LLLAWRGYREGTMLATAPSLESTFARELPELTVRWHPREVPDPALAVLNEALCTELGIDIGWARSPDGVAVLAGAAAPPSGTPVAQAYTGHQFGLLQPRLGDGRAVLLGELRDRDGRLRDLHLKGSGATVFARGGDGRAVLGPMLREWLVSEYMHRIGIPTTRALAVVATGERVLREDGPQPGAVLCRVASSHLRVGTFVFAASAPDVLRRLTEMAIARHHPQCTDAERPALALLEAVCEVQARLIAQWMCAGFVHGVMNTDNMTVSGETIDYGPCAFIDAFDPGAVFSSIDANGRYAFGNQPLVAQWNLARFAEALLPLLAEEEGDEDAAVAAATEVLGGFTARFGAHWRDGMRARLGLGGEHADDEHLIAGLLETMRTTGLDYHLTLRGLAGPATIRPELADWAGRWRDRANLTDAQLAAAVLDANPLYLPRNHIVEAALDAANGGDLAPAFELAEVLTQPFDAQPGRERFAAPPPGEYRAVTYCGT